MENDMIVYRICKKEELEKIFMDNSFLNVGYKFDISNLNTHQYNKNSRYLHFFLDKDSMFYLRTLKDRYVCIYDIPCDILKKYEGIGYYYDYINYSNLNEVIECAVETSNIKIDYLKQVSYIKKDIDYEDLIDDYDLSEFVDAIYNSVDEKRLVLEKYY